MTAKDPTQEIPRNLSVQAAMRLCNELGIPVETKSKHIVLRFAREHGGNYSVSRGKKDAGLSVVKRLRRLYVEKYGEFVPQASKSPAATLSERKSRS